MGDPESGDTTLPGGYRRGRSSRHGRISPDARAAARRAMPANSMVVAQALT